MVFFLQLATHLFNKELQRSTLPGARHSFIHFMKSCTQTFLHTWTDEPLAARQDVASNDNTMMNVIW